MEKHLTVSEVAERLNCSRSTITELIESGRLKAYNLSLSEIRKTWRIDPTELAAFIQRQQISETPSTIAKPIVSVAMPRHLRRVTG